jgi:hypothetical protein
MDLIFNKVHAHQLREKYTVLELETIQHPNLPEPMTAWCVVPAEKVIAEIELLPLNCDLHANLIDALHKQETETVLKLCTELKGKFGGELDTFYETLEKRIQDTGSCVFVPADNQTA